MSSWLWLVADLALAITASCHALLNKRDPRAVTGWIAVCFLTPFAGSLLYFVFGVNRVRTRARRLAANASHAPARPLSASAALPASLPARAHRRAAIAGAVTGQALLEGNRLRCLYNGEQAYPAMLEAINGAEKSLFLATYIFDTRRTGHDFMEALQRASKRGVDVRVLIDGIGELTGWPPASYRLAKRGVRVARFIPPRLLPPTLYINLRNHRKILVVDGRVAFTGGMNISGKHLANSDDPKRVTDVHFRLTGPVVSQIQQAFLEDWAFASDDATALAAPPPHPDATGPAFCRTIVDGPNEYLDQLERVLVAVISSAQRRVMIMTPYFLPSRDLMAALRATALRGVEVTVILPFQIDHRFVQWAARNILHYLIRDGGQVLYQPPPFCHSKLLLVDEDYALVGSANLDPRSLRLNFELAVEVFDRAFATELWRHCRKVQAIARPITLKELADRSLPVKLRDALAWTCSPYL